MPAPEIRFCRVCGTATVRRVPPMEDRERAVCPSCGYVDYVNPVNVVGTVPVWVDESGAPRILLCLRNIEPRKGFWTLPAGFHEVGETTQEGAVRETLEEAGARVSLEGLFSVQEVVHVGQVHLFYRARLLDLDLAPGGGDDREPALRGSRTAVGGTGVPDCPAHPRGVGRRPRARHVRRAHRHRHPPGGSRLTGSGHRLTAGAAW